MNERIFMLPPKKQKPEPTKKTPDLKRVNKEQSQELLQKSPDSGRPNESYYYPTTTTKATAKATERPVEKIEIKNENLYTVLEGLKTCFQQTLKKIYEKNKSKFSKQNDFLLPNYPSLPDLRVELIKEFIQQVRTQKTVLLPLSNSFNLELLESKNTEFFELAKLINKILNLKNENKSSVYIDGCNIFQYCVLIVLLLGTNFTNKNDYVLVNDGLQARFCLSDLRGHTYSDGKNRRPHVHIEIPNSVNYLNIHLLLTMTEFFLTRVQDNDTLQYTIQL